MSLSTSTQGVTPLSFPAASSARKPPSPISARPLSPLALSARSPLTASSTRRLTLPLSGPPPSASGGAVSPSLYSLLNPSKEEEEEDADTVNPALFDPRNPRHIDRARAQAARLRAEVQRYEGLARTVEKKEAEQARRVQREGASEFVKAVKSQKAAADLVQLRAVEECERAVEAERQRGLRLQVTYKLRHAQNNLAVVEALLAEAEAAEGQAAEGVGTPEQIARLRKQERDLVQKFEDLGDTQKANRERFVIEQKAIYARLHEKLKRCENITEDQQIEKEQELDGILIRQHDAIARTNRTDTQGMQSLLDIVARQRKHAEGAQKAPEGKEEEVVKPKVLDLSQTSGRRSRGDDKISRLFHIYVPLDAYSQSQISSVAAPGPDSVRLSVTEGDEPVRAVTPATPLLSPLGLYSPAPSFTPLLAADFPVPVPAPAPASAEDTGGAAAAPVTLVEGEGGAAPGAEGPDQVPTTRSFVDSPLSSTRGGGTFMSISAVGPSVSSTPISGKAGVTGTQYASPSLTAATPMSATGVASGLSTTYSTSASPPSPYRPQSSPRMYATTKSQRTQEEILAQLDRLKAREAELTAAGQLTPSQTPQFSPQRDVFGAEPTNGDPAVVEEMERERVLRLQNEERLRSERENMEKQYSTDRERLFAATINREKDALIELERQRHAQVEERAEQERAEWAEARRKMEELVEVKNQQNLVEQRLRSVVETRLNVEHTGIQNEIFRLEDLIAVKTRQAELEGSLRNEAEGDLHAITEEEERRMAETSREIEGVLQKEHVMLDNVEHAFAAKEREIASLLSAMSAQENDLNVIRGDSHRLERRGRDLEDEAHSATAREAAARRTIADEQAREQEKEQEKAAREVREAEIRDHDAGVIVALQERVTELDHKLRAEAGKRLLKEQKEQKEADAVQERVTYLEKELARRVAELRRLEKEHAADVAQIEKDQQRIAAAEEKKHQLEDGLVARKREVEEDRKGTDSAEAELRNSKRVMKDLEQEIQVGGTDLGKERANRVQVQEQVSIYAQKLEEDLLRQQQQRALEEEEQDTSEVESLRENVEVMRRNISDLEEKVASDEAQGSLAQRTAELERRIRKEKQEIEEFLHQLAIAEEKKRAMKRKGSKTLVGGGSVQTSPATTKGLFASDYASYK